MISVGKFYVKKDTMMNYIFFTVGVIEKKRALLSFFANRFDQKMTFVSTLKMNVFSSVYVKPADVEEISTFSKGIIVNLFNNEKLLKVLNRYNIM